MIPSAQVNFKLKYIIAAAATVLFIANLSLGLFFWSNQNKQTPPEPEQFSQEVDRLVLEIGQLINLPTGEEPTVATVTDIEKLKDQPFFQKAKNGDKVLIYTQAKKAILYDPNAKKIIDVAPINIGSPSAQQTQSIKIVLRNGTKKVGLTSQIETDVRRSLANANIVTKENAAKDDYEKTIVVVLNDQVQDEAEKLADDLRVSTGDLPKGESRPKEVDILVILGQDKI